MDLYTIWADKEGDISDIDWVNGMKSFLITWLKKAGWKPIESHVARWGSVASQTCLNGSL